MEKLSKECILKASVVVVATGLIAWSMVSLFKAGNLAYEDQSLSDTEDLGDIEEEPLAEEPETPTAPTTPGKAANSVPEKTTKAPAAAPKEQKP